MTTTPIALPTPEQVHKVCEYLGDNDASGHCQKCPRRFTQDGEVMGKMCYSLAEETILKVWDACSPSAPLSEAAKAAARKAGLEIERMVIDWIAGEKNGCGLAAIEAIIQRHLASPSVPIDVLLFCPKCGTQHVDAPEPENGWTNPPHRKHLCHACKRIWLAALVPTNGVAALPSPPDTKEKGL